MKKQLIRMLAVALLLAGGMMGPAKPVHLAAFAEFTVNAPSSFFSLDGLAGFDADGSQNGTLKIDGDLTLNNGGSITCNDTALDQPTAVIVPNSSACNITIVVTGNFLMHPGSAIKAENALAGGDGGNITITVDGNVTLEGGAPSGAVISSRKTDGAGDTGIGGNITIKAGDTSCVLGPEKGDITVESGAQILADAPGNAGDIDIRSGRNITIDGLISSVNSTTVGRAGRITIIACCKLRIGSSGIVRSVGRDPGADLVHIEGCTVEILGLVQSSGDGHNDAGAIGANACNNANHVAPPGASFRACIEVWSGSTLLIDASGALNGQLDADTAGAGGTSGRAWIDVYANGDITIKGNEAAVPFAVHANQGVTNAHGGVITVKSKGGDVIASKFAVQADATNGGADGGQILVQGIGLDLDTASLYARGDFVQTGGFGKGGTINARAFQGALSWEFGVGDVRPTGADTIAPINVDAPSAASGLRGVIALVYCASYSTAGTTFPFNGNVATTPPAPTNDCSTPAPTIPDPAGARLAARIDCQEHCEPVVIPPPPPQFCSKDPVRTILDNAHGRFPGNAGPDVVVRVDLGQSIQAAISDAAATGYDAAHNGDGYIIIAVSAHEDNSLGGHTNQSINISATYDLPFALIGCSVTMHDPTPTDGAPTAHVESFASSTEWPPLSGENMFLMDLHAADSKGTGGAGWKVEGNGRYVRNTYGTNSTTGMWFVGDNNVMHNGKAEGNTEVGIKIEGNGNTVESADSFGNGRDGVNVSGEKNVIDDVDSGDKGKGNGWNGFVVSGNENQILESSAFANSLNGFNVTSTITPNVLKKNAAGDRGKANGQNGFLIVGNGNSSTDIQENTAKANVAHGFTFTGSGHKLKSNKSGGSGAFPGGEDNGDCEFNFAVAGNLDGGGNKANGANMTLFTAGCRGTP